MPRQPEGKLKARIKAYLQGEGAVIWAIHGGGDPFQEAGIPDLIGCWRGHFLALEIKLPGRERTATPLQVRNLQLIERAGGIAGIVTSIDDVKDLLAKSLGQEKRA